MYIEYTGTTIRAIAATTGRTVPYLIPAVLCKLLGERGKFPYFVISLFCDSYMFCNCLDVLYLSNDLSLDAGCSFRMLRGV